MKTQKLTMSWAKSALPKRKKDHHKSLSGKSLIIAGSPGMYGAAVLAGTAAARVGSGYTQILTDLKNFPAWKHPDFLTSDVNKMDLKKLEFTAAGIGPGLGVNSRTFSLIKNLIKKNSHAVVLDADALSVIAKNKLHPPLPSSWILTPHEGELARLMDVSSAQIKKQRLEYVLKAQKKFGCIILLKGSETLITDGEKLLKVSEGTPALSKAGTGDVLTGMITGFLAQGLAPMNAAGLAAYVHGLAARRWSRFHGDELGLLASDLLNEIPLTMKLIRSSK